MPTKPVYALLWSDGIHFVRRRTMPDGSVSYKAGAHDTSRPGRLRRTVSTMDGALQLARKATAAHLRDHPEDEALFKASPLPAASSLPGVKRRLGRVSSDLVEATAERKIAAQAATHQERQKARANRKVETEARRLASRMSFDNFIVSDANPVAQVYKHVSTGAPSGRPGRAGRPSKRARIPHSENECAVIVNGQVVLDADGRPRVFSPNEALRFAEDAYENEPEDERLLWKPGQKIVYRTHHIDVVFDTEDVALFGGGVHTPFVLRVPSLDNKVIFMEYIAPVAGSSKQKAIDPTLQGKAFIEREQAREAARAKMQEKITEQKRLVDTGQWDYEKGDPDYRHGFNKRLFERFKFLTAAIERAEELEQRWWGKR